MNKEVKVPIKYEDGKYLVGGKSFNDPSSLINYIIENHCQTASDFDEKLTLEFDYDTRVNLGPANFKILIHIKDCEDNLRHKRREMFETKKTLKNLLESLEF